MSIDSLKKFAEVLNAQSPSFCLAKWKQETLHLYSGNTQSCHHVRSHVIAADTLSDPMVLNNSPEKIHARKQMKNGERPSECDYCWRIEDVGELSDRVHKSASLWARPSLDEVLKPGSENRSLPSYLEIAFASTCQFKCMYCGPSFSTSWQAEIEKYGPYPDSFGTHSLQHARNDRTLPLTESDQQKYRDAFWQWLPQILPSLHHLRVTGGEPFLSEHTFSLIDHLCETPQPHLQFSINSNMGFGAAKLNKLLDKLNQLQQSVEKFSLFTSIDTFGPAAEYIRFGLKRDVFFSNLHSVLSAAKTAIGFDFMITVNALSLSNFSELLAFIRELRLKYPQHHINFDVPYLRHPEFMSLFVLPIEFCTNLDEPIEFIRTHLSTKPLDGGFSDIELQRLERIQTLMRSEPLAPEKKKLLQKDFFKFFVEYDKRRGTDFLRTFPDYREFWQDCSREALYV